MEKNRRYDIANYFILAPLVLVLFPFLFLPLLLVIIIIVVVVISSSIIIITTIVINLLQSFLTTVRIIKQPSMD